MELSQSRRSLACWLLPCWLFACCLGCRSTRAPLHVWVPPKINRTAGKSVLIAEIVGPDPLASQLQHALLNTAPPEPSRQVQLITQQALQTQSNIQLASAVEQMPSDVALLHAAHQHDIDYLLFGEILQHRRGNTNRSRESSPPAMKALAPFAAQQSTGAADTSLIPAATERVTVSWKLLDVRRNQILGGLPVTISSDEAATNSDDQIAEQTARENLLQDSRGPEAAGTDEELAERIAVRSWELLSPHIKQLSTPLAEPWLSPGSREIRRGNALAEAGKWAGAEQIWQQVVEHHPRNHAALHNLALAAVARQDLVAGKQLARQALVIGRKRMYGETVIWIEQRQLDLANSFALPPPPGGWLFVRPQQ